MRILVAIFYSGFAIALTGVFMLLSSLVGAVYRDGSTLILLFSGLITTAFGAFPMLFIPKKTDVSIRESIFVVAFGWVACGLAGALPFYLYGAPFTIINSIFESFSGFTTTGASILSSPESLPKGLLFWRSLTHWLGGIGIVAFALTVMPQLGQVSKSFLQQEYSGLGTPPVHARARDIVRGLFAVYLGLTLAETLLLMATGLSLFDASTISLATLSTGGFSVRNAGIAHYGNIWTEIVVMFFMITGGLNFVYMHILLVRPKLALSSRHVPVFYISMLLTASLIVAMVLFINGSDTVVSAIRFATFQIVSYATSTGFATTDSSIWPVAGQIILMIVANIGACAGSTAGAIKSDRIYLFFKLLRFRFMQLVHPNVVASIRVGRRQIALEMVERATFYIIIYLLLVTCGALLFGLLGMTSVDSLSGSIACMSNTGPGLGSIGSISNWMHIPELGKIVAIILMLLGRLEVFALVLPFTPGFWRS